MRNTRSTSVQELNLFPLPLAAKTRRDEKEAFVLNRFPSLASRCSVKTLHFTRLLRRLAAKVLPRSPPHPHPRGDQNTVRARCSEGCRR